jgi:hypothetical protein
MHAPIPLLIASAILGVIIPLATLSLAGSVENPVAELLIRLLAFAIVPLLVARVAYRQGYDRAAANSKPLRPGTDVHPYD